MVSPEFHYVTSGYYGGDSAQSGYVSDEEETWMQTSVTGLGTFKFWWKVSSESGADYLEFYLDTQLQDSISGSTSWAEKSYNITGAGAHTLKWRYVKDSGGESGEDCAWVDHVQWSAPIASPPTDAWSTLTYTYDASGRRIEKRYDDTLVLKYIYAGDHCIAEYDSANNLRRKYIFGQAVDQPICMIEGSTTNYYHYDALGSVIALSDGDGDTVQVYEYDVYGRVGATDPDHSNRFMFTGREFDKETGLYYYRARYYNAEIGRFLQTDPIGYGDGMNLYRYCLNNPLLLSDPSGRDIPEVWPDGGYGRPDYPGNWTLDDFFWWYFHGPIDPDGKHRQAVTLEGVGLRDDVQNLPDVKAFQQAMIRKAVELAESCFASGATHDCDLVEKDIPYSFAYGWREVLDGMRRNDPTTALGRGFVHAAAWITVQARPYDNGQILDDSGVTTGVYDWTVQIEYWVRDAFVDILDLGSDDPGNQDLPGGMGFDITDNWWWEASGTVSIMQASEVP